MKEMEEMILELNTFENTIKSEEKVYTLKL